MSALTTFFGFKSSVDIEKLPEIFPLPIAQGIFVETDVQNIFSRILTDVLERTDGIPEKSKKLLWDNCLGDENQDGLVTLIAKAMMGRKDLFLVYIPSLEIIRLANEQEKTQIRSDYATRGTSEIGTFITFKNFTKADMVKLYSALEYCTVSGLYKGMNLSKAVQVKLTDLRASVNLVDSGDVVKQAKAMAEGLSEGRDVLMDAKDLLEMSKPDLTATTSSMEFIAQKMSFYLGLPASYITGEQKSGMSDSGKANAKDIERGLKGYYFSIIKPVIEKIFGAKTTFKTEDFDSVNSSLEVLRTFELTSDEYISKENKQMIVNQVFRLPEDAKGDEPEQITPPPERNVTPPPPQA